ncbi:ADP-ribosylation/Crystallin J1 [Chytriomyces sp. MP71]|nr:ADP-ribosylation/Crystallin J1 [Chytriomyces sp. MP71]
MSTPLPTFKSRPEQPTSLSKEEFSDKVRGLLFGAALGDAYGVATEFMTRQQAEHFYGKGPIAFGSAAGAHVERDGHRRRWKEGEWTDDTDQQLLLLNTVIKNAGLVKPAQFAQSLIDWLKNGFPKLAIDGNQTKLANGIGFTVGQVLRHPAFLSEPSAAAMAVWMRCGCNLAANGAVMRTACLGVPFFWDEATVVQQTIDGAAVTHADPRSIVSCVIVTVLVSRMLRGLNKAELEGQHRGRADEHVPLPSQNRTSSLASNKAGIYQIVQSIIDQYALSILSIYADDKVVTFEPDLELLQSHILIGTLRDLDLHNGSTMGYTYKCLGSAVHCFARELTDCELTQAERAVMNKSGNTFQGELFKRIITELTLEAGDADTNCTVAGALLGCRIGYTNLPKDWLEGLQHSEYLMQVANQLCNVALP